MAYRQSGMKQHHVEQLLEEDEITNILEWDYKESVSRDRVTFWGIRIKYDNAVPSLPLPPPAPLVHQNLTHDLHGKTQISKTFEQIFELLGVVRDRGD